LSIFGHYGSHNITIDNARKCSILSNANINGINRLHSAWTCSLEPSFFAGVDS
jgi:hypothetical protein